MREAIKVVNINEKLANYIQMLNYEVNGYRNLMASICKDTGYCKDTKMYNRLIKDYLCAHKSLELALSELVVAHCNELEDVHQIYPTVDFVKQYVQFIRITPEEQH